MVVKDGAMATLRDVAREAQVSVTTASAAIRHDSGVKDTTRDRVLVAARKVNYTANLSARMLKQGRSNVIAFIVPDLSSPYFSDLASAISREAAKYDMHTIVQQTNASVSSERDFLRQVNSPMCDGVIINLHNISEAELGPLIGSHPAVLFEDYSENPQYDNVLLPLEAGFKAAFVYLKSHHYVHAAVVGAKRFTAAEFSAEGRNAGASLAVQAMIDSGLGSAVDTIPCEWSVEGGLKAAAVLAQADLGYDALFCMNDLIAFGLIRGLQSMGIRVPEDKAVFGFDGVSPASYTTPALSTIAVDFDGMANMAVGMLVNRINGISPEKPLRETAGFRLIRGESA